MTDLVAAILGAHHLPELAKAYETAREILGELADTPIRELDVASLTGEQCCQLDIVHATNHLVPIVDAVSDVEKIRINESAGRFLVHANGDKPSVPHFGFDPDFALSSVVRQVVLARGYSNA